MTASKPDQRSQDKQKCRTVLQDHCSTVPQNLPLKKDKPRGPRCAPNLRTSMCEAFCKNICVFVCVSVRVECACKARFCKCTIARMPKHSCCSNLSHDFNSKHCLRKLLGEFTKCGHVTTSSKFAIEAFEALL